MTRRAQLLWSAGMGLIVGFFGGIAALALLVIARELGLVPMRLAERYEEPALVALLLVVPILGAVVGYLEGRAKLD